ncbi:MAG: CRTAC1 family protein, partial [Myxococcota bacterium]
DVDGDGFDDLFVANGRWEGTDRRFASRLFRNEAGGRFVDISASSGVASILAGRDAYSVAAADVDADGDLDLYVTTHPHDVLLRNRGDGTFVDGTADAQAGGPPSSEAAASAGSSKIASFGDVDGDGHVDVVVASSTFDDQPTHGYLLRNRGDGTFEDVTAAYALQVSRQGNPCAVMWSDLDNDGDQDLWVWNDRGAPTENRTLLRNEGDRFVDITRDANVTDRIGNPMGIDAADIDRDGHLDVYVSAIGNNPLYLSRGNSVYDEVSGEAATRGDFGWGLGFEDFNLDGWPDLFVAQEDDLPYLTFTHLGPPDGGEVPRFTRQAWAHSPTDARRAHNVGAAFADVDRDGRVDVVTATTDGSRVQLFRNETDVGSHHWLEVRVRVAPETGQAGGTAARIAVKTGDVIQFRDVSGGSSRASQSAVSVRFGLGHWTGAEWVAVLWADGRQVVRTGVEGNRRLEL